MQMTGDSSEILVLD